MISLILTFQSRHKVTSSFIVLFSNLSQYFCVVYNLAYASNVLLSNSQILNFFPVLLHWKLQTTFCLGRRSEGFVENTVKSYFTHVLRFSWKPPLSNKILAVKGCVQVNLVLTRSADSLVLKRWTFIITSIIISIKAKKKCFNNEVSRE